MGKRRPKRFKFTIVLLVVLNSIILCSTAWGSGLGKLIKTLDVNQRKKQGDVEILFARHRGGRPHGLMHSQGFPGTGVCPQLRTTPDAPDEFLKMKNPLQFNRSNILAGKELFAFEAQPTACKVCHGLKGNGLGIMAHGVVPMPRNFACKQTMKEVSDGQMFYIITHGTQGTNMPSYSNLSDEQVWQLITYIRTLAK